MFKLSYCSVSLHFENGRFYDGRVYFETILTAKLILEGMGQK